MKKFLGVATGLVLVVAAARAAGTDGGVSFTLQGNVPAFCYIHEPIGVSGNSSTFRDTSRADFDFSQDGFSNYFANADGVGLAGAGGVVLSVKANATCRYILTSDNGVLATETGATRDYYAWIRSTTEPPSDGVHLSELKQNALVRSFDVVPSSVPEEKKISIEYKYEAKGVLHAGTYRDTLRLVINAF